MPRRLPCLKSLHRKLRTLLSTGGSVGMLHFYLEAPSPRPLFREDNAEWLAVLSRSVETCLVRQKGCSLREDDLLAHGDPGEWFVFLVSPPRSREGLTRHDLQEVERRVARELRASIREALPRMPRCELPPLRSGLAVLHHAPATSLGTQLDVARYEARLHGRVSRLLDDQISGLNHKIRTPLTTVKGVIELIRDDPEALPRFLPTLEHEVDRIQSLLKQFSLLTRIESGLFDWVMQPLDLAELVQAVVEAMQGLAQAYSVRLQLTLKANDGNFHIQGCVELIEEATRQIIDNAVRHGARGRRVKVLLETTPSHASLQVADRGPGIPEEDLPHIFQPFYTVGQDPDIRPQGGGLGLCLARGVMEIHRGGITCESRPEHGTRVTMRFPVLSASASGPGPAEPHPDPPGSGHHESSRERPLRGSADP